VDPKTGTCDRPAGRNQGKDAALHRARSVPAVLYVTNEQSDTVVPFRVDRKTGHLTATGNPSQTDSVTIAFFQPD